MNFAFGGIPPVPNTGQHSTFFLRGERVFLTLTIDKAK
jgi:hypothetical protein